MKNEAKKISRQDRTFANRWLKLAEYLRSVPRKAFNMTHWVGDDWDGNKNLCGTTACAAGHATTMPAFKRLGLKLNSCKWPAIPVVIPNRANGLETEGEPEDIFGPLAGGDALWPGLFYGPRCSPKQMAERIRKAVKEEYGITAK